MTVTVNYIPYEFRNHQLSFDSLEDAIDYWEPLGVNYQVYAEDGIYRIWSKFPTRGDT